MKFVKMADPFGGAPLDVRRKAVMQAATEARAAFDEAYPRIVDWFDSYDPLYVLSFCVTYFLATEQGVDREAIDGKLDFAPHHLELLQAFALMRRRAGTPAPLKERAEELRAAMKGLTDNLQLAQLANVSENASESEIKKHFVINEMRSQTLAIRNWAFPEQTYANLRKLFAGALDELIARDHGGVFATRLVDALVELGEKITDRLNSHIAGLRQMWQATTFDDIYGRYRQAFAIQEDDTARMRVVFQETYGANIESLKSMLLLHSDLFLDRVFTFTIEDASQAYGDDVDREALVEVIRGWSHRFGDLASLDPLHFLYGNPVLVRPFIEVEPGVFFWVLSGVLAHTMPAMLEGLIPTASRPRYYDIRAKYLEDSVEALLRLAFPNGSVFRGSQWQSTIPDLRLFENDLLVIIDSTAIIVECKSHHVDPPARRGGEFRLIDTLSDLVVSASDQAQRFADYLKANPKRHEFSTRRGAINDVDATRLVRFIPISVTYENLGFVSANLKEAVSAGFIEKGHALVPSICVTDLEVAFEVLSTQAERIHYLARRAEIERTMNYHGDEMDLLAFYLDTGFNVGDVENGDTFIALAMKSKELDPYFVARADGVSVPKPALRLTDWWKALLEKIELVRREFWTEVAYVLLSVAYQDQLKFERNFLKLADRVDRGVTRNKYDWLLLVSGTKAKRQYGVLGFPFKSLDRDTRNRIMKHMAAEAEQQRPLAGMVIIGMDLDAIIGPYNVLVFIPGHGEGAPPVGSLLPS